MSLRNKRSSAEACYGLGRLLLSAIMMIPLTGELSMCISEYLNSINLCCMSIDEQFTLLLHFTQSMIVQEMYVPILDFLTAYCWLALTLLLKVCSDV